MPEPVMHEPYPARKVWKRDHIPLPNGIVATTWIWKKADGSYLSVNSYQAKKGAPTLLNFNGKNTNIPQPIGRSTHCPSCGQELNPSGYAREEWEPDGRYTAVKKGTKLPDFLRWI